MRLKKVDIKLTKVIIFLGILLLSLQCNINNNSNGGTESGNAKIIGMLYQKDGKTPAKGVCVMIRPRKSLLFPNLSKEKIVYDSVFTDNEGRFLFDSTLDYGIYTIEALSGNDGVLIDFVVVKEGETPLKLPPYTLRPTGAIKGVIRFSEEGDPRKILILVYGIDRIIQVRNDGSFEISNLAEGSYDLRIVPTLDNYDVIDTMEIPVISGDTTELGEIILPFKGIPIVQGLSATYDTMKIMVQLKWKSIDTSLISGYHVYRKNINSDTMSCIARLSAMPQKEIFFWDSSVEVEKTYEYRVTALDKNGNQGLLGNSVKVSPISSYFIKKIFDFDSLIIGSNNYITKIIINNDTLYVLGINQVIYVLDIEGNIIKTIGKWGTDSLTSPTTFTILDNTIYIADKEEYSVGLPTVKDIIIPYIKCFSRDGSFIKTINLPLMIFISGLVVISDDEIFLCGSSYTNTLSRIFRINSKGEVIDSTDFVSSARASLLCSKDSLIIVNRSWYDSGYAIWFNRELDSIAAKTLTYGGTSGHLGEIALDKNDNIYAAVNNEEFRGKLTTCIKIYNPEGKLLSWFPTSSIRTINIDSKGLIYIGIDKRIIVYQNRCGSLQKLLGGE
ncbi:MAG: hypothetical protein N2053_01090 [Chitinispirillaceae bacterium]|nr:hypothetical protein [Chitinispirillaceae bacterium]